MLPTLAQDKLPYEHLQLPGEIVFLPSGWWHFIINVEDTIAVTQNFVPLHSLEAAVRELAQGLGGSSSEPPKACQGRASPSPADSAHGRRQLDEEAFGPLERGEFLNGAELGLLRLEGGGEGASGSGGNVPCTATGFLRSRHLGAWLKALCEQKPELTSHVVSPLALSENIFAPEAFLKDSHCSEFCP